MADARALDHRHVVTERPLDDDLLERADLVQPFEVLLERPLAAGRRVAKDEVARMLLGVVDAKHGVNEERALDLGRHEAGHEVDALDRHRPALVHRPVDRRLDADEDTTGLLQEARPRWTRPSRPASKLDTWTDGISDGGK